MKLNTRLKSLTPYLMVVVFLGLQACSGGGGTPTPVTPANANPIGYYAGTLSTVSPVQSPATATAKAIVDSDKFLLVHIDNVNSNTLLYVGTFTNITATTFTADVVIYHNGVKLTQVASITNGSITEKSSLSGTMSGTGDYTSTSFSLTYDTTINGRTPRADLDSDIWKEPLTVGAGDTGMSFNASTTDYLVVFGTSSIVPTSLRTCTSSGIILTKINSEQLGRIRKYNEPFPAGGSCVGTTLVGYITTFDNTLSDDRYLWITYDDNNFFAGELVKQP